MADARGGAALPAGVLPPSLAHADLGARLPVRFEAVHPLPSSSSADELGRRARHAACAGDPPSRRAPGAARGLLPLTGELREARQAAPGEQGRRPREGGRWRCNSAPRLGNLGFPVEQGPQRGQWRWGTLAAAALQRRLLSPPSSLPSMAGGRPLLEHLLDLRRLNAPFAFAESPPKIQSSSERD